jgi:hypothetical protein
MQHKFSPFITQNKTMQQQQTIVTNVVSSLLTSMISSSSTASNWRLNMIVTQQQQASFWIGFVLALVCIFGLQPLSTEKIQFLKEFDDLLLS